jgi:hypothetical protein
MMRGALAYRAFDCPNLVVILGKDALQISSVRMEVMVV